jgi:hypothetical protein
MSVIGGKKSADYFVKFAPITFICFPAYRDRFTESHKFNLVLRNVAIMDAFSSILNNVTCRLKEPE